MGNVYDLQYSGILGLIEPDWQYDNYNIDKAFHRLSWVMTKGSYTGELIETLRSRSEAGLENAQGQIPNNFQQQEPFFILIEGRGSALNLDLWYYIRQENDSCPLDWLTITEFNIYGKSPFSSYSKRGVWDGTAYYGFTIRANQSNSQPFQNTEAIFQFPYIPSSFFENIDISEHHFVFPDPTYGTSKNPIQYNFCNYFYKNEHIEGCSVYMLDHIFKKYAKVCPYISDDSNDNLKTDYLNISGMFNECTNLKKIPEFWALDSYQRIKKWVVATDFATGCTKASNYNDYQQLNLTI